MRMILNFLVDLEEYMMKGNMKIEFYILCIQTKVIVKIFNPININVIGLFIKFDV